MSTTIYTKQEQTITVEPIENTAKAIVVATSHGQFRNGVEIRLSVLRAMGFFRPEIATSQDVATEAPVAVYLEQTDTASACWYVRQCDTQEVLHVEPSGRGWALEACKELNYHIEYEVWPRRIPANQMNPLLQAQIDAGELLIRYKEDEQICACGATMGSLRELFGDDLADHITACQKCGGELHTDDGGAKCITCGWRSYIDAEGSIEEFNPKTGERKMVRDVAAEREAFMEGYSFMVG